MKRVKLEICLRVQKGASLPGASLTEGGETPSPPHPARTTSLPSQGKKHLFSKYEYVDFKKDGD